MLKQKLSIAFFALLSLLPTHITFGNQEILVGCYTEIGGYPPSMEYWGINVRDGCYEDILEILKTELKQYGFSVTSLPNREDWSSANLVINSPLDIHGAPTASIEQLKPKHLTLSSMLAAHPTDEIVAYASSPQKRAAIADLATAIILYASGNCEAALPYFDNVRESTIVENSFMTGSGSFNPPIRDYIEFYKGNCALLNKNYLSAIKHFESFSSQELFWGTVNVPNNLAWTYFQTGEYDLAFETMNQTIEGLNTGWNAYPRKQAAARKSRAQLYALTERYDDAISDLNTAIELDPGNPELYTLRGQMYLALYEWDSALADYNRAIELDPDYADAYYERGVLYYSILQTGVELRADALADFQYYLELAPDGDKTADAARYVEQIEAELAALEG